MGPQFQGLLVGHQAYFSKGDAIAAILQEGNVAFVQIIIFKMGELVDSGQKPGLVEKFLGFGFGVILLQMRFLLFGHAIVQIVLGVEHFNTIEGFRFFLLDRWLEGESL